MRFLVILFAVAVTACATTASQPAALAPPLYKYRANMQLTVDGKTFDGMGVTSLDSAKDIEIVSQAALDLLRITTCSRDKTVERVDHDWWGGSGKAYTYHYEPTAHEKEGVCPIYFEAVSKDKTTDWGFLAFRTNEALSAEMDCNGTHWKFAGLSVCQTKAGHDQLIKFSLPVKFASDESCQITQRSPQEFLIRSNDGFCEVAFSSDGKDRHHLILLGYESVLLRGQ